MDPTSYCSITVLQGPTRNPGGFLGASAAFHFFSSCEAPGGMFHSPPEAAPPHRGFEFLSFTAGAWLCPEKRPFSLASPIPCLALFALSSWDRAHSPCTPAPKKPAW